MGLKDFFRGFGKKAPGNALVKYVPKGPEAFLSPEEAKKILGSHVLRKTLRGAAEGGVVGGLGGGAMGYRGAEPEEKGKGALRGAAIGALGGAGLGSLIRASISGVRAARAAHAYGDQAQRIVRKRADGKVVLHPDVEVAMYSDPAIKKKVMADDFLIIDHPEKQTFYSSADKGEVLDGMARGAQAYRPYELHLLAKGRMLPEPQIRAQLVTDYLKHSERAAGGKVAPIIDRLKSEGVDNSKAFASKYHPDKNPNVPKDIKENFGQILDRFRQTEKGEIFADEVFSGFSKKQQEHIQKANKAIKGLK